MTQYDAPPLADGNSPRHRRQIAQIVTRTMQGKLNCVADLTIAATPANSIDPDEPTITTIVADPLATTDSFIHFMPLTSSAAEELATGQMYVSDRTAGQFTLTHRALTVTNRRFRYIIIG